MRKKISKSGLLGIVATMGVLIFVYGIRLELPSSASAETTSGAPQRLLIPRIHVNANIEAVSRTSDGLVASPERALDTGWYKEGPKPGEEGSAVIGGAVHWEYGPTAMFGDLHFIKIGDTVSVVNDRGETTSFVVVGKRLYDLDENTDEVFRSSDGKSRLNLVTVDGVWDKKLKSYSKRLVVFTEKKVNKKVYATTSPKALLATP